MSRVNDIEDEISKIQSNIEDTKNLIVKFERPLQKLKEQKASLGLYTPPHILIDIEDKETELSKLRAELEELQMKLENLEAERITIPTPPGIGGAVSQISSRKPKELFSIAQQFAAPGRAIEGLAFDETNLWLSDNSGTIFKVDTSGKILGNFSAPDVTPQGMAWDGFSFWVYTTNKSLIYQFQIIQQETKIISSFRAPARIIGGDITWSGKSLWYTNEYNVYELDLLGNIISSFVALKEVTSLGWDGSYLWLAHNDFPAKATLTRVDITGKTQGIFPSAILEINGLEWARNGDLWVSGRDTTEGKSTIYKLDVSGLKNF